MQFQITPKLSSIYFSPSLHLFLFSFFLPITCESYDMDVYLIPHLGVTVKFALAFTIILWPLLLTLSGVEEGDYSL